MQTIQQIFLRLQENKKQLLEVKKELKVHYVETPGFTMADEEKKVINEKLKALKAQVHEQYPDLTTKMEDLKIDIESDKQLLTDIVMTDYVAGKTVEVKDQFQQQCFPLFTVKFVKQV
jgi:hypothetical protein